MIKLLVIVVLKDWLRVFRAQTAPATIILVILPILNGGVDAIYFLIIVAWLLLVHYFSFGHNSLMDTAMGYDLKDPSKAHHPLVKGSIDLSTAHKVIHFGLMILFFLGLVIAYHAVNSVLALTGLLIWIVAGHAYNDGLSKESVFAFIPISLCTLGAGLFGWGISHQNLNVLGILYLAYVFLTIWFQISYEGCLKDLGIRERSNFLIALKARLVKGYFLPGYAWIFAVLVKEASIVLLWLMALLDPTWDKFYWLAIASIVITIALYDLIVPRKYVRSKELRHMSGMEILSIYAPIPLLIDMGIGGIIMILGLLYFYKMNKFLWKTSYPKV